MNVLYSYAVYLSMEYYYFISAIVGYIGTATEHIPLYYSMFVFQSIHPIQCQTCPVSPKINKKSEDELQSNPLNTKNLKEMQRFSKSDAANKRKKNIVTVVEHRNKNIIIEPGLLKEYMNILFLAFVPIFESVMTLKRIASR